jgi:hypothetical protein
MSSWRLCEDGKWRDKRGNLRCEHGVRKTQCRECGGSHFCEHGKRQSYCKDCGGSQICEHGRLRWQCKDCGGSQICEHGRKRCHCKECGGSQICEHGEQRSRCKDCGGSQICEHGRRRSACGLCGGTSVFKQHSRGLTKRGLTTELTEVRYRWLITQPCAYCGEPAGGVDRAKNQYGYTILNSVPSCSACNFLKGSKFDAKSLLDRAHKIAARNADYEQFKTRWHETRTSGPDLEVTT